MQCAHGVRCATLGTTPFSQNAFSVLLRCWPFDATELARGLCKEATVCAEIKLNCDGRLESCLHGDGLDAPREEAPAHSCQIMQEQ